MGVPYAAQVEPETDPLRIDHVWITVEAPPFGRLRIVVNTLSRLNRDAGFDPRIRLGIIRSTWPEKPTPGLVECPGHSYEKLEAESNVFYETFTHDQLTELLLVKARTAIRVEVWGDLYARDHLGIHQIHSRRASNAVPQDVWNRDGALGFFYPDGTAELLLFKFDGQP